MRKEGAGLVLVNRHRDTFQSLCHQAEPVPTSHFLTPTPFLRGRGLELGAASQQPWLRVCAHLCERSGAHPGGPAHPEEAWM